MTVLVRGIVTGSWFMPWTLASVVLVLNPGVSQSDELWRVYSRLISSRLRLPQPCKKKKAKLQNCLSLQIAFSYCCLLALVRPMNFGYILEKFIVLKELFPISDMLFNLWLILLHFLADTSLIVSCWETKTNGYKQIAGAVWQYATRW